MGGRTTRHSGATLCRHPLPTPGAAAPPRLAGPGLLAARAAGGERREIVFGTHVIPC
jgi:hypothetical protein